jgi:ribonucleoside-diphosphate reductase beta chain
MHPDLFTESWLERWRSELNGSAAYRDAADHWTWPIVFTMWADPAAGIPERRSAYLDLYQGSCREARVAADGDLTSAPYVIGGAAATWQRILDRQLDPVMALVRRKLRLERGSLLVLTRQVRAARELVAAAARATRGPQFRAETASVGAGVHAASSLDPSPAQRVLRTMTASFDHDSLPMRLYHKAKRLGVWDPQSIDFARDREDWLGLSELEQEVILHLTALFQAGEESVTGDILPLMQAVTAEGRIEEELYLSTFLFEEAKHTEFFRRFLDDVAHPTDDLTRFHGPSYRRLFCEELPSAMGRLHTDRSPMAQAEASVTYNMIVEGTLAETGYHAYHAMLERNALLPGLREGIGLLKRDESRHVAYGLFLLSRLLAADPGLWRVIEARMEVLIEPALGVIHELFDTYERMPFGLVIDDFVDYAMSQFENRLRKLDEVRGNRSVTAADLSVD